MFLPVAGALGVAACATRVHPPPKAPTEELPPVSMPESPAAEGSARVVLDVLGGPAEVQEVTSRTKAYAIRSGGVSRSPPVAFADDATTRPLCATTPCVVDLAHGSHELIFVKDGKASSDFVVAGGRPSAFRLVPEERTPRRAAQVLGAVGLGIGLPTLLAGGMVVGADPPALTSDQRDGWRIATGVGAGLVLLSTMLLVLAPPEYRPSVSRQWELPERPR